MHTHSAKTTRGKGEKLDLTEVSAMVFPGEGEGVSPILVEYIPVAEPLLLRDHPTRRYAMVYTLTSVGGGRFRRGELISASVVDVAERN
jgi:hypothetical protein